MVFREIPGYPDYLAGDDGLIYTGKNTRGNSLPKPRELATRVQRAGYVVVQLRLGRNLNRLAHVLVALAFLGERNGLEVNHKNGDKRDNRPTNLEYVTRSENCLHAIRTGLKSPARGRRIGRARLSAESIPAIRLKVAEIRSKGRAPNGAMRDLAKEYGVTPSAIDHVARGDSWGYL